MSYATVIYLGSYCNKDCSYCDREYIKNDIGDQRFTDEKLDRLIPFLQDFLKDRVNPTIGFHGGEPFLYTHAMSRIIDSLPDDFEFSILTNATLLEKNKDFLMKYGNRLKISISYDFFSDDYRGYSINLKKVLDLIAEADCRVTQLQWVIPSLDKRVFGMETLNKIVEIYQKYKIGMLTLIPLRHIRGKTKFKSIIDEMDVPQYFAGLLQFIQLLYVLKINVSIDGHSSGINKRYFDNHKQVLLSPDGYIYPEFDFLDYRVKESRIGSWDKVVELKRSGGIQEKVLTLDQCKGCPQFHNCGVKYLYKLFEQTPSGDCVSFYAYLELMIDHYSKLKKHKNLIEAI